MTLRDRIVGPYYVMRGIAYVDKAETEDAAEIIAAQNHGCRVLIRAEYEQLLAEQYHTNRQR